MKNKSRMMSALLGAALMADISTVTIERDIKKNAGNASWMRPHSNKQKKARAKTKRQSKARSIMRKAA